MAKKVRVHELARELGLTNKETLALCTSLGIGVKTASSSMEDAHADRVRRKADREGLRREPEKDEEPKPAASSGSSKPVVSTKKPPPGRPQPPRPGAAQPPKRPPSTPRPPASRAPQAPQRADRVPDAPQVTRPAGNAPTNRAPVPKTPPPGAAQRVVSSRRSQQKPPPARPASQDQAPTPPTTPQRPQQAGDKRGQDPAARQQAQKPAQKRDRKPQQRDGRPQQRDGRAQGRDGRQQQRDGRPQQRDGRQQQRDRRPNQRNIGDGPPKGKLRPGPGKAPLSASGKPIPPPPGPPTSRSGKPIPPPPGMGGRRPSPRPSGPAGRGGPSGPRPGGAPGPHTGGPPRPGGGRPGGPPRNQQRPRRRRRSRRRRNLEELRPVDVPQYTPEGTAVPEGVIIVERQSTPQDLGPKLNRTAADIVRWLLTNGEMVMATESMSDEQIEGFCESVGAEIRIVDPGEEREEEMREILEVEQLDERDAVERPPVITVMGHVDHGKTRLLDTIRKADVGGGEAGGITQHIGAYQVKRNNKMLTFIDTPGHAAFTAIRARGAEATDIVVLVVAADDGVMPQTIEAINHAKVAEVPIVVAINKMDREGANPDRVMQQLAEHELVPEDWGGDTVMVKISALKGDNIDGLLDALLLVAELEELTAAPKGRAAGVVLESKVEVGMGAVATVLVQQGQLKVGEPIVAGGTWGRVRAMIDDHDRRVKVAGPSTPVKVLGLKEVPRAGDEFVVAQDEKTADKVAETRAHYRRVAGLNRDTGKAAAGARLEDLFEQMQAANAAKIALILRADTHGSLEALADSLARLERPEVKIDFLHKAVGAPTENDVQLAQAAGASIIAFNVRPDRNLRTMAQHEGVDIRTYEIIYKVIEDIEAAVLGEIEPEYEEVVTGEAEVRAVFRIKGVGLVAGCYVKDGVVKRNDKVRFLREGVVIWHGTLTSLKRFTEDATEVRSGFECGVGLSDFQDLQEGDVIETYEEREIKPK